MSRPTFDFLRRPCPGCGTPISPSDIETHTRDVHPEMYDLLSGMVDNLTKFPPIEVVAAAFDAGFVTGPEAARVLDVLEELGEI